MDHDRLPKRCFLYLLSINNRAKNNWSNYVKDLLYEYGFYDVWQQHEIDVSIFINILK